MFFPKKVKLSEPILYKKGLPEKEIKKLFDWIWEQGYKNGYEAGYKNAKRTHKRKPARHV